MKWFVVVIMMWQSDGTTPLWIPFETFESKDECVSFVQINQMGLFQKAIEQYEGRIPPQQISCVEGDDLKSVIGVPTPTEGKTGV